MFRFGSSFKPIKKSAEQLKNVINSTKYLKLGKIFIEEEAEIVNSTVRAVELQKKENSYELRFVIMTRDEKLIEHYHTVVYSFKDLKFEE